MRTRIMLGFVLTTAAMAGEYDSLMAEVKKTWAGKTNILVVCDHGGSKDRVAALASAASGMKIDVIDVKGPQDIGKAVAAIGGRHPDFIVLIAGDRVAGDGTPGSTFIIQRVTGNKIPVIGTTEAAVKAGAVFAVGAGTGGKILGNPKTASLAGVSLPAGAANVGS